MRRSTKSSSVKSRPTKRRKVTTAKGSEEDPDLPTAHAQSNLPSSSAWSIRTLPSAHIPSLTTLCIRSFTTNVGALSKDPTIWAVIRQWLRELPDMLVERIFAALRDTCPSLLSHGFITAFFLRGSSITLTGDLPGVSKFTVLAIAQSSSKDTLRELELSRLDKITDNDFASVVSKLVALQVLILRGCTNVGTKTVAAVAKACQRLVKVNLNYTSVTPISLAPLLKTCKELEVLKLAGIPNWTDANVAKLWTALGIEDHSNFRLLNIKTLNIRQTSLTDSVLNQILDICPNIQRLDLSFTPVRHPPLLLSNTMLEKLSLTSTSIAGGDLLSIISDLPRLKSLALGAIGGGQGSSVAISNTSAMTMTDQILRNITDILEKYTELENVSLVGNTKLGSVGRKERALTDFIHRVGRRCTRLNLAGISSLRSSDLEGLGPDPTFTQEPSPLQVLVLNNTNVDDDAAPFISSCPKLRILELAGTKVTNAGLFPITDACSDLEQLNLTSCRGIGVVDRRHFFEMWETQWKDK